METKNSVVTIAARPEPFTIDLGKAAILVIDMQNDFCSPGGGFDRAGIPIGAVRSAIPHISTVLAAARKLGVQIAYLKMEHQPDLSDLGGPSHPQQIKHAFMSVGKRVVAPDGREGRVLVKDTWNTEIVPELAPQPGDVIVSKKNINEYRHRL